MGFALIELGLIVALFGVVAWAIRRPSGKGRANDKRRQPNGEKD